MDVCTQVDAFQEIAVAAEIVVKNEVGEAAAAFDPETDAKENRPKRVKLEIVPEVPQNSTTYRAMYYKSGLCLKSCAYICEYNINMNRHRHTHTHTHTHDIIITREATELASENSVARKSRLSKSLLKISSAKKNFLVLRTR